MKFCNSCAGDLVSRIPDGDNRERHVCARCGTIHYQNPKIVTGCPARMRWMKIVITPT